MARQLSTPLDLSQAVVGLERDGGSRVIPNQPGPPVRIAGFIVGAPAMTQSPPHGGEMHPDGDELLFLVSGHVSVVLEDEGSEQKLELRPGEACVVPRGVWHRVVLNEPSQILHITPGPGGEHRPPPKKGPS
jgi:mannose-6-phosphate isomerase-like protein (cupin superfamily)